MMVTSLTLSIVLPYFTLLLPLELFPNIPPNEQKLPIEGFGGKNFPFFCNSISNSPFKIPEPTIADFLLILMKLIFFISIMMP